MYVTQPSSITILCEILGKDTTITNPLLSIDVDADIKIEGCECGAPHYLTVEDLSR